MASPSRLPVKTQPPAATGAVKSAAGAGGTAAASRALSIPPMLAGNWMEFGVPIAVLGIVLAMIAPLPPFLLDILISANITMSVIVLLVSLYITKPVDFSVFPTTLLLMTLFRLALNVSSARLILLNGNTGTSAAGEVIQAFALL
jgi:flagellar biosynthesis protein FlhA